MTEPDGDPPPRRRARARAAGDHGASRVAIGAAAATAAVLVLPAAADAARETFARALRASLTTPPKVGLALAAARAIPGEVVASALPLVALAGAAAVAVAFAQTRGAFVVAGRPRWASPGGAAARAAIAGGAIAVVGALVLAGSAPDLALLTTRPALAAGAAGVLARRVARAALPCLALLALADVMAARRAWRRRLQVPLDGARRDELEASIAPHVRDARARVHRELLAAGSPAVTEAATLVVRGGTHVAVALRWEEGSQAAPVVVATGAGPAGAWITAVAERAGVPVRDAPDLARALREHPVGAPVPPATYDAVAALLVELPRR